MSSVSDEFLERTIVQQLHPRCITQSWLYEPDVGDYVYRISWSYPSVYTLQRSRKDLFNDDRFAEHSSSWDLSTLVEEWVSQNSDYQEDTPRFALAYHQFISVCFKTQDAAWMVILDDIKQQLLSTLT